MTALITRDELRGAIERHEVVVVDALPSSYFDQQHLPGALNLFVDEARERAFEVLPDKDAAVVAYCSNAACPNSEGVARVLTSLGYTNTRIAPLASNKIHFAGQIVALVVAETFEAAREAAGLLGITCTTESATADMRDPGATARPAKSFLFDTKLRVGDTEKAYGAAPFKVDMCASSLAQRIARDQGALALHLASVGLSDEVQAIGFRVGELLARVGLTLGLDLPRRKIDAAIAPLGVDRT